VAGDAGATRASAPVDRGWRPTGRAAERDGVLIKLETGAVAYVVAGPRATRLAGVAAGLRATFPP
jgi:hypothetical protein